MAAEYALAVLHLREAGAADLGQESEGALDLP
jgi:hypothetical protein